MKEFNSFHLLSCCYCYLRDQDFQKKIGPISECSVLSSLMKMRIFCFFVISFVFQASAPVGSGAAKAVDTNLPSSCVVFCFLIGGASSKETSSSSTSPIE